jgi:hypothetical protein
VQHKIQHSPYEKDHESSALIVSELSFVVHFGVAGFQRFTYGNSAATLVAVCTTLGALAQPGGVRGNQPNSRKHLRHLYVMEKQGL